MLVLVGGLFLEACGDAADTGATSTTESPGEPLVIKTRMAVAAQARTEPIATGEVLDGSTLGGSPFCAGGTIVDTHGSSDPADRLIVENITCSNGTVHVAFTPDEPQGLKQTGSWMIVSGTGAFEGLRGTGELQVAYSADDDSLTLATFTGTVTR